MKPTQIFPGIWWVGVNDRLTPRFEQMWHLQHGISYNSYLINDEKVALIDGALSDFFANYLSHIEMALEGKKNIDYLIINHMEPDHSSAVELLLKFFPDITVVTNKMAYGLLKQFCSQPINFKEIKEGEELPLGTHTLKFFMTPNVHWPETMVTYETTTHTLFTCDAFGSYGALDGSIFDDQLDPELLSYETRRYYATIVGRFNPFVQKALQKVRSLDVKALCPSHGPVYRTNIDKVLHTYDLMSRQDTQPGAVVLYGSMYGHTALMAEACAEGLSDAGVNPVRLHDVSQAHISDMMCDIWYYRGLALFTCCYNMEMYPAMKPIVDKMINCKVSNRVLGLGGNYSWSKGLELKYLLDFAAQGEFDMPCEPIEVKSNPSSEELQKCREMGRQMGQRILEISK